MEQLIAKLTELGLAADKAKEVAEKAAADGATDLASAALLSETDLIGYGVAKITARKIVAALAPAPAAPAAAPVEHLAAAAGPVASTLPELPSDDSLLEQLVTGGTLRFAPSVVVHAMRVLTAEKVGIWDIESRILDLIEARAERENEQVPDLFFDIERNKLKKKHAEVLRAMGISGGFVSASRKKAFLTRFSAIWDVLANFHDQLAAWRALDKEERGDLTNLVAVMKGGVNAIDSAPYDHLIDAARTFVDEVSKMFGATGVVVAQALAADALELRKIVERPELPAAIGATSRDAMLRELKLNVSHDMARVETNAAKYVLSVLEIKNKDSVTLYQYLIDLYKLGQLIGFDSLRSGGPRPNGTKAAGHAGRSNEYGTASAKGGNVY